MTNVICSSVRTHLSNFAITNTFVESLATSFSTQAFISEKFGKVQNLLVYTVNKENLSIFSKWSADGQGFIVKAHVCSMLG